MAKAMRYYNPRPQYFIGGVMASGAKLFFYTVGTTTKKDTYTDSTKNTANPNPVILDSQGRPANSGTPIDIFLDGAYKVVLAPSTDTDPPANAVWTEASVTTIAQLETTVVKSSNYQVLETDRDKTFLVDATSGAVTITLIAAATAGDGFTITVKKTDSTSNAVIVDGSASETIDGSATYSLLLGQGVVKIICNGTAWFVQYQGVNASTVSLEDSRTNTIVDPFSITATTSGSPAAGIGTGLIFAAESADESPSTFGRVAFEASDVGSGTEDTFFSVWLRVAGAAIARAFSFKKAGAGNYVITGTPASTRTITLPDADITIAAALTTGAAFSTSTGAVAHTSTGGSSTFAGTLTGNRTYTFPDADYTIPVQAVQAGIEAETNQDTYIPPDLMKFHPGIAKAWVKFAYTAGAPVASASYNISSLTDSATGEATINFTTSFSSANYAAVGTALGTTGNADAQYNLSYGSQTTGSILTITTSIGDASSNSTIADQTQWHAFFGDFA